jgi:hypothetical protein
MMRRQRYRVAPEPPPPQLSLREEIAIYKAKLRAIKVARDAAKPSVETNVVTKPKKRPKMRNEYSKKCFQAIGNHFKTMYHDMFSGFKRKSYMCMGFFCCMPSEMRVFVDEEFPAAPPVI